MVSDADMLELQDAGLARLAQIQLAAAEKLHLMIQASDDASEVSGLAKAVEGVSRSLRLTYALRVKLRKDVRSLAREETRIAEGLAETRAARRRDRLRDTVETLTWREADWEDESFLEDVDHALDEAGLDPQFLELPLEEQVAKVIQKLGLRPNAPPPLGEGDREAVEGAQTHSAFQNSA